MEFLEVLQTNLGWVFVFVIGFVDLVLGKTPLVKPNSVVETVLLLVKKVAESLVNLFK